MAEGASILRTPSCKGPYCLFIYRYQSSGFLSQDCTKIPGIPKGSIGSPCRHAYTYCPMTTQSEHIISVPTVRLMIASSNNGPHPLIKPSLLPLWSPPKIPPTLLIHSTAWHLSETEPVFAVPVAYLTLKLTLHHTAAPLARLPNSTHTTSHDSIPFLAHKMCRKE